MTKDTNKMFSVTEENQNFLKVADTQEVLTVSERLIRKNMETYKVFSTEKQPIY